MPQKLPQGHVLPDVHLRSHILLFSKLFDLTGKRIAAPIAHSQHNAVIAACFMSGTVCTFIFHAILIKTAHLRSRDPANPVLLKNPSSDRFYVP